MTDPSSEPAHDTYPGDPKQQVRSNPTAGCVIIMLAFAMFLGVASYGIYAGIKQDGDIAKFASDMQESLPTIEASTEDVTEIRARLDAWAKSATSRTAVELRLNARDLNVIVQNLTMLMEVRGTVWFEEIRDDRIHARIAMPMNRIAFWKSPRYLNGTCTMKVESAEGRIYLRFDTFDIPKAEPPTGFVERMKQSDLLAPYKSDEDLAKIFDESVLSARIEGDTVIVETTPMQ